MFKSLKHVLGKWKRSFFDERTYDDLIEDGWEMTGDGFWVKDDVNEMRSKIPDRY